MLKYIGLGAALRPDTFQVRRSASIKAKAEQIFPLINDLHRFNTWNPFDKKDPNLKRSYSGPESGKGREDLKSDEDREDVESCEGPEETRQEATLIRGRAKTIRG